MVFVIFDPATGIIAQSMQCTEENADNTAKALSLVYLEVSSLFGDLHTDDYSSRCVIENGAMVDQPGE